MGVCVAGSGCTPAPVPHSVTVSGQGAKQVRIAQENNYADLNQGRVNRESRSFEIPEMLWSSRAAESGRDE